MTFLQRLFGGPDRGIAPHLYTQVIELGRQPHWYQAGEVPDSVDGRFDMIAASLAILLLRLEGDPQAAATSAALAECFIEDMDGQLREQGVGDIVVGKHIGKMMGMVGGRLGAYRDGLAAGDLKPALVRNLYRGKAPSDAALAHVEKKLTGWHDSLRQIPVDVILTGRLQQ